MKQIAIPALLCSLLLMGTTACSPVAKGQDPAKIKVELVSEPALVTAGTKVKLIAKITGLEKEEGAQVQLDIRRTDNSILPDMKEALPMGGGQYYAEKTFDKPASYSVYIHLYQGELHITKKKELIVS
ncbi:hypothetical protein PAESOLCIP111_03108 [Paenibacillus solanacearum]|uniref:YtkA-like domain-containing protein n=1 Tax=Paenibacillus solanacearum TaxID=2048548 RepID=A0A916NQ45_9BACL|nr:hypothetical protein [Paenibacillus solanacearum]CAG7629486.1 hypothetical protein PAESOLCIP111_03108 [Paenibacillus solanacearum]